MGKLHVYPQRNRIGFDDVLLAEEGRGQHGVVDDYELFLGEKGHPGEAFGHGMANNQYVTRTWHLPEELHNTNWTADKMSQYIKRRDPTRPGLFYMSFVALHPPLTPPEYYHQLYRYLNIDSPVSGEWSADTAGLPAKLQKATEYTRWFNKDMVEEARKAFYATITHIDHQIRKVIGTLREEGLLEDTYILFTSDHGDMLGNHGLWAKRCFYEYSARVPLILAGPANDGKVKKNHVDSRLTGIQDIMPTLLDLCDIPIPETVEGISAVGSTRRDFLYGEEAEGMNATRMIHDGRYKLIYYASGNCFQLFDIDNDSQELIDLSEDENYTSKFEELKEKLLENLYGTDKEWVDKKNDLKGLPPQEYVYKPIPGLFGQRGSHWPPQPHSGEEIKDIEGL